MSITGPFHVQTYTRVPDGNNVLIRSKHWHRQTRPYVLPLAHSSSYSLPMAKKSNQGFDGFVRDTQFKTGDDPSFSTHTLAFLEPLSWPSGAARRVAENVYARAYDRFVARVQSTADLLVTLAEAGEAWDLIHMRSLQLVRGIRAWRNRNWAGVFDAFGIEEVSRSVMRSSLSGSNYRSRRYKKHLTTTLEKQWRKDAADGWLELNLGWGPLVSDIGNAVEVLQGPLPEMWVKGTAKGFEDARRSWSTLSANCDSWGTININWRVSARLRVVSPNLRLASQLGFINLPATAWAVMPGSFLFDWFIPVGKFLTQWTDLMGFDIDREFRSSLTRFSLEDESRYASGEILYRKVEDAFGFHRVLNIEKPSLLSRSCFYGRDPSSWWRGLTAFALLQSVMLGRSEPKIRGL